MKEIYICCVGIKPEPFFRGLNGLVPDKVVLVNSRGKERLPDGSFIDYYENEKRIIENCGIVYNCEIETVVVDAFDYYSIYDSLKSCMDREKKAEKEIQFHVNITLGTNIMAAALGAISYYAGADLRYVKRAEYGSSKGKDEVINISMSYGDAMLQLQSHKKVVELLRLIGGSESVDAIHPNDKLRSAMNIDKSTLSNYTARLKSLGLIENRGTSRNQSWWTTSKGTDFLKRL